MSSSSTLIKTLVGVVTGLALFAGPVQAADKLSEKTRPQSGFIPDYSVLQKVDGPKGTQLYRYRAAGVRPDSFHSAIVDPVLLNQTQPEGELTAQVLEQTRAALEQSVLAAVAGRPLKVVKEPGPGVLRISVALSGAELETEGFKPRNLLPISAVMKIATRATGTDAKTPTLLVESKLVDTQSQELVGAGMITIAGESFRQQANTAQAFQAVTKRVVEVAVQAASGSAAAK